MRPYGSADNATACSIDAPSPRTTVNYGPGAPRPLRREHEMGHESFATVKDALESAAAGARVRLRGWLHRTRSSGGIVFSVLRDGSGLIQVTTKKGSVPDAD